MSETRRVSALLKKSLEHEIKRIALDITDGLIEATPVDTGWAMANWIPSIGTPFEGPVGAREAFDTGEQEVGQAAVAAQYQLVDGPVFITNYVPYIEALNAGSSPRAPAGFVEAVIDRAVDAANRRILSR